MRDLVVSFFLRLLAAIAVVAAPLAAGAEEAPQVEQLTLADDPFEITDPHAADPGEAELAIVGIYERARQGAYRSTFSLDTELQLGVVRNLELRVGSLGAYGNLETRGRPAGSSSLGGSDGGGPAWGGSTRVGVLYQISDGRGVLPLASVLGRVRTVYGPGTPSYEGDVVALFGKTLGTGSRAVGLNLNLGWTNRFAPMPGERPGQYSFTAAVGRGVTPDAVVVLAYARRQQERHERDFSLVEAGIRYRISNDAPILGFAVGAGTTRNTPALQVSLAAQWTFGGGSH
jgi:hypothetical protein